MSVLPRASTGTVVAGQAVALAAAALVRAGVGDDQRTRMMSLFDAEHARWTRRRSATAPEGPSTATSILVPPRSMPMR